MKYLIFFLLFALHFSGYSCRIRIISSNITYTYSEGNVYTVEPQIRIRRSNQCRTLILEVTPNGESEFIFRDGGSSIPISVNFDRNDNFNSRASVVTQTITPVANGTFSYPFYFSPVDTEIPLAGNYDTRFTLRVYEQEAPGNTLASRNNRHRMTVPPIFSIDFGGSGSVVDFGNLEMGKEASIQMQIDGNIAYNVSMRSQEGGVLKNTFNPATIRYLMYWQGTVVPITTTYSVVGSYGQGQQIGIIRTVIDEDTAGKTDGQYRDVVEVLVETQ